MSYKHLRPEERHYIEIELKKGTSQNEIAHSLVPSFNPQIRMTDVLY
ncbi:MAG: helix-turn-helix domain-containing protein [Gammaproteobacteria bacterium]|jgi:hypothetical protein|nr:helix-turn-helix domain-containing protein [Gammaproteobacteria bacterium]MBT5222338.1 helix-turn-helix domain-containing protein [Gammaproteobacteria bacterium]MBT5825798.1 helix-turn-helix domain-containing protein [Gammaproteobacteria bacterium]MBT6421177.1 helix-turn-helix domain-containing protein [Gammaproteobacteria bacterium]MBT6576793.1 helix-turn-helix domain-containing protein [Gammaproteobacteria bacterium]